MLQRQVMFKQLQELQRRQQLQDLDDTRNQNFGNQLSSLKHASAGQFSANVNGGSPILDSSQMFLYGNMESLPVGLPPTQFDISSYGTHAPNDGKNFDQYSHLQGPSTLSGDLRTKDYNNLGVATMQPSPFGGSFMNQQFSFPSDRIRVSDGQVPIEGYNRESLSGNYSQQGIPMQGNASLLESEGGHQDADWDGFSPGKSSNPGLSGTSASLDPLEQKILYGTDDNIWDSSLNKSSKMSTGGFQSAVEQTSHMDSLPSLQSGSWSALMQSAVAETSSSDTGMQEQWSGSSLKNPEALNGSQLPNIIESQQLQNNWVSRNLQNAPPPNSGPEHMFQNLNVNHSFSSFQESGRQYGSSLATSEHFPGNTGHLTDYSSQQKLPTKGTEMIHAPLSSTMSPAPGFRLQSADNQAPQGYSFFPTLGSSGATYLPGNSVNDADSHLPALPVPRSVGTEFPEVALQNSELKIIQSGAQQFPLLENNPITQTSLTSDVLQHGVLPTPWPNISAQQDVSARKPFDFSNLFGFPNSTSSSIEATKRLNQLESYDQQLKQGTSLPESSSEINNSMSHGSTNMPQYKENLQLEAGAVESSSLTTNTHQQASHRAEGGDNEVPSVPHGDIGASSNSLSQNNSVMHQLNSSRNIESDGGKTKYNNLNRQKLNPSAMEPFWSGHKSGVEGIVKSEPRVVRQLGAFWSRDRKDLNLSQETQVDESGRASLTAHQKQMNMLGENNAIIRGDGSMEASNLMHTSQINLQTAPSWIKHYGAATTGNMLPMCEQNSAGSAQQQLSELQQNSLTMQVSLDQANPAGGIYPPTAETSVLFKQLSSPSVVASDMNSQKLVVSVPKKRKLAEFSMVPWRKEIAHEPSRPLEISIVEQAWAQVLNKRVMEVRGDADVLEEYLPKRRLICTTLLLQQVFGPIPAVVLRSNATSKYDIILYSAARLTLGDACNMSGQLLNDTNDISPEKSKTFKRPGAYKFSKIAEGFDSRVKKLQAELESFSTKSLSHASMRVEAQELDKFSMINRFARIHIKASQPSTADAAASSTTLPRNKVQRYVVAVPMPSNIPEGADCLSL